MPGSTLRIVAEAKKLFFDSAAVRKQLTDKARAAMARQGAYIRSVARNSMRRRRKPSPAGRPPSVHQGSLKRLLFFAFDPGSRALVAGPLPFDEKAAPLLEFGGVMTQKSDDGGKVTVRHPARPFMGPALEKSIEKFPQHWRGRVRR